MRTFLGSQRKCKWKTAPRRERRHPPPAWPGARSFLGSERCCSALSPAPLLEEAEVAEGVQGPHHAPLCFQVQVRSGDEHQLGCVGKVSALGLPWTAAVLLHVSRTEAGRQGELGKPRHSTLTTLFQRHQLLFLFLPLLKVDVDQRLQQRVLFHALRWMSLGRGEGWSSQVIPRRRQPAAPLRSVRRGPWTLRLAVWGRWGGRAAAVRSMSSRWQRTPCSDPRGARTHSGE